MRLTTTNQYTLLLSADEASELMSVIQLASNIEPDGLPYTEALYKQMFDLGIRPQLIKSGVDGHV